MKAKQGFSLIEVLVAVVIVAILVAFALPVYQRYSTKTMVDRCFKSLVPVQITADSLLLVGMDVTAATLGVNPLELGDCSGGINVSQTNGADTDADGVNDIFDIRLTAIAEGNTMRLTRDRTNGVWTCTSSDNLSAPETC